MIEVRRLVAAAALVALAPVLVAAQATPSKAPPRRPLIEDRGRGRYRIGRIKLDQVRQRFFVRGVVLRDHPPLEYLAITADGFKGYESLLKLHADAYEFNLGCILIGLDPDRGRPPRTHFDPQPAQGDPVDLRVSWLSADGRVQVAAADLVQGRQGGTLPRDEWVYTGSKLLLDGRLLAEADSSLIGFVHDPATLIEHRTGFLRQFDSVTVNTHVAPRIGTPVTLRVARGHEASAGTR